MRADEQHAARGLLILDEPTVFLPKTGADRLFELVREIVNTGASVLFVSHDLDEVAEITDRVTVFRDGQNVGTIVTKDANPGEIVELIIGRKLTALEAQGHDVSDKEIKASVRGLKGGGLETLDLDLHAGEVLGVTGLAGSGFEQIPYLLFGAWRPETGRLGLDGNDLDLTRMIPSRAIALGMALIPADRQKDGAVGSLPIVDNISLQVLKQHFNGIKLDRRGMTQNAREGMGRYDVRPNDPLLPYGALSGGNQQKALLAKWMQTDPSLLLLHEPTQGVDVGARHQIFTMIRAAAEKGMSVICASSDYEQLATICDRVYVFGRGRVVSVLTGDEVTKERITEQCYNSLSLEESVTQ
jgi:ribose transport system ATP-binding protein